MNSTKRISPWAWVPTLYLSLIHISEWIPELPSTGQYAVYVSYKSLPNSTDDALYTVYPVSYTHLDVYKRQQQYRLDHRENAGRR